MMELLDYKQNIYFTKLAVIIAMNNTMLNHEEMYYKIRTEPARLA